MNRIITRLRTLFVHPPLGFTATVSTEAAYPVPMPAHGEQAIRHWTPAMPLRLANGVMAARYTAGPDPSAGQSPPETGLWSWQSAEGIDKPLAYSR